MVNERVFNWLILNLRVFYILRCTATTFACYKSKNVKIIKRVVLPNIVKFSKFDYFALSVFQYNISNACVNMKNQVITVMA